MTSYEQSYETALESLRDIARKALADLDAEIARDTEVLTLKRKRRGDIVTQLRRIDPDAAELQKSKPGPKKNARKPQGASPAMQERVLGAAKANYDGQVFTAAELTEKAKTLTDVSKASVSKALSDLHKSGRLRLDHVGPHPVTKKGKTYFYAVPRDAST